MKQQPSPCVLHLPGVSTTQDIFSDTHVPSQTKPRMNFSFRAARRQFSSRLLRLLILGISLFAAGAAFGQPGTPDLTFNTADPGFGQGDGASATVRTLVVQPDGKVLAGGDFVTYNGIARNRIMRLNTDGTMDATFTVGSGANAPVYAIALQPDGKVLIAGDFTAYNGTTRNRVARLNSDGTLDATFNPGTGASFLAQALAVQADGKTIVAGAFAGFASNPNYRRIVRLNADGTVDNTFNMGTGFDSGVSALLLQPDGKIVVTGSFTTYNNASYKGMMRLNTDGTPDATFNSGSGPSSSPVCMLLQPDGKFVLGGIFSRYNGTLVNRMVRVNANGTIDNSFSVGTGPDNTINALALQPDGKFVVVGDFTSINGGARNRIARLQADGSLDNSLVGAGLNGSAVAVAREAGGALLVGGDFSASGTTFRNRLLRLQADGSLDAAYGPVTGANANVWAMAVQPDDKILVGGEFISLNNTSLYRIARLNDDGSIDNSFNVGTGANGTVRSIKVLPNGKLLVGGVFTTYNGTTVNYLVRLNADGSIDNSFSTGAGFNGSVVTIAVQPDGKILVGGAFTAFNGSTRNRIVRLNADGSLDASFDAGTGYNADVLALVLQPDGKVLVAGFFSSYNGTSVTQAMRLNANGSIDFSFTASIQGASNVYALALQADGKVLAGGSFLSSNGTLLSLTRRFNPDGSLDNTYSESPALRGTVVTLALQPDGKVLLGGDFLPVGAPGHLLRLNANGSLDNSFAAGTGANNTVQVLTLQPDGKVLAGGLFTAYNGTGRNRIMRVNAFNSIVAVSNLAAGGTLRAAAVSLTPNPAHQQVTVAVQGFSTGLTATLLSRTGALVKAPVRLHGNTLTLDLTGLAAGVYVLQLVDTRSGERIQRQLVKL